MDFANRYEKEKAVEHSRNTNRELRLGSDAIRSNRKGRGFATRVRQLRNPLSQLNLRNDKWRRRESNAYPQCQKHESTQQLTSALNVLGVSGECLEYTDCHRMAGIDAGLWKIINVWHTLPEAVRKEVEPKCLEPASRFLPE